MKIQIKLIYVFWGIGLYIFSLITGVSSVYAAGMKKPLEVMVSILPQEYFVKRIGQTRVQVQTLVQPGHSPATYAPAPKQMATLANSEIYFRIGVPFENALVPKLVRLVPGLDVVDLRQGIDMVPMEESHNDGDHVHDDLDPHTWLDPKLALQQSEIIRDTLIQYDREGEGFYNDNFTDLANELQQLDHELKVILKPLAGKSIYVFHPAYGYFCRAYGLEQIAINPYGKQPGAQYLARLIEKARAENVHYIFVQPQFSEKTADSIARAIGGSVVALDPLAYDYVGNLQSIARKLASTLRNEK